MSLDFRDPNQVVTRPRTPVQVHRTALEITRDVLIVVTLIGIWIGWAMTQLTWMLKK